MDRLAHQRLERLKLTLRRPELQLGVARGAKMDQIFLAAVVQLYGVDRL